MCPDFDNCAVVMKDCLCSKGIYSGIFRGHDVSNLQRILKIICKSFFLSPSLSFPVSVPVPQWEDWGMKESHMAFRVTFRRCGSISSLQGVMGVGRICHLHLSGFVIGVCVCVCCTEGLNKRPSSC
jgi:hypothetical protein